MIYIYIFMYINIYTHICIYIYTHILDTDHDLFFTRDSKFMSGLDSTGAVESRTASFECRHAPSKALVVAEARPVAVEQHQLLFTCFFPSKIIGQA